MEDLIYIDTHRKCKISAFSLVEISIVLVILGLLVGGILAGQSLIRASEMRAVTRESAVLISAFHTFRDKYFAYPGDMANATGFWGSAGGTGSDIACRTAGYALDVSDIRTCNGNGDGMITSTNPVETTSFWEHLQNAGLLEGSYGIRSTIIPNVSSPPSKINSKAGWYIAFSGTVSGSVNVFNSNLGNTLNLLQRPTAYGVLTGAEAWNVDTKLDDGRPGTGKLISNWSATFSQAATACTTASSGADSATATYQLDKTSTDCGLYWAQVF